MLSESRTIMGGKMSNHSVLVVGGAGYVGGCLVDQLMALGFDVTVYDNLIYESRFLKPVKFIYGDVRDKEKLSSILTRFQTVIWLAAIVGDGACAVEPFLTQSINEESFKWLVNRYNGKIVFASTCSVYGINNDIIDELATPNPLSEYARTKLAAEQYLMNNHDDFVVVRLGTLYGLGDAFSRVRFDLVVNILAKLAAEGKPLKVFGGEQWRPLLHVRDVSEAIVFAILNDIVGCFNLHYDNYRIIDLANTIREIVPGTQIETQSIPFEDTRNYRVSSDAFRKYGWTPAYGLHTGICEIVNLIREKRLQNPADPVYSNVDLVKRLRTEEWVR